GGIVRILLSSRVLVSSGVIALASRVRKADTSIYQVRAWVIHMGPTINGPKEPVPRIPGPLLGKHQDLSVRGNGPGPYVGSLDRFSVNAITRKNIDIAGRRGHVDDRSPEGKIIMDISVGVGGVGRIGVLRQDVCVIAPSKGSESFYYLTHHC